MAMQANAAQVESTQLGLYDGAAPPPGAHPRPHRRQDRNRATPSSPASQGLKLCAGCRAKEARYGFRDDEREERPRTLCFACFRMELDWRQRVNAQLAKGWNAEQERLPLAATLKALHARRRRAQIAARHALGAE